ncbi:MBOAT family O-acyltransferase [Candidiatus Paracoxiella cheracis]|uniref:MBOAT family O-acyltransferase n=1 Tax=Candidiatus Paracoxiella cheracis TaxID=3405120 RepID=UPI003BF5D5AD
MYKLGVQEKRRLLALGIGCLVAAGVIVYYNHADTLLTHTQWFMENKLHASKIILPIGISFFTFTQIAFLVDVYQRKVSEYRLLNYTLFVSYFPHFLAGPIIHHAEMMPQFTSLRKKLVNYKNIYTGLFLFSIGLFKKVVLADTFGIWANSGYASVHHLGILQAWATVLSYTFQLYFDFSGYTDMAIGISWMFNIQLPINFNSPYKSLSIREFWQRWHITLSRFLKSYLYIFIGGNRVSESKVLRNFLIVFLIGGIWHGAGWTFVMWGFMHGIAMSIRKLWQKTNIVLPTVIAWFITFNFVNFAWIYFRSKTLHQANSKRVAMLVIDYCHPCQ